jgi:hypothetical protein
MNHQNIKNMGQQIGQTIQPQYGMNYQTNGVNYQTMLPMPNQIMRPNNNTNSFTLGQNLVVA